MLRKPYFFMNKREKLSERCKVADMLQEIGDRIWWSFENIQKSADKYREKIISYVDEIFMKKKNPRPYVSLTWKHFDELIELSETFQNKN